MFRRLFNRNKAKPTTIPESQQPQVAEFNFVHDPSKQIHYVIIDKPFILEKALHSIKTVAWEDVNGVKRPKRMIIVDRKDKKPTSAKKMRPIVIVKRYRATYIGEELIGQEIVIDEDIHTNKSDRKMRSQAISNSVLYGKNNEYKNKWKTVDELSKMPQYGKRQMGDDLNPNWLANAVDKIEFAIKISSNGQLVNWYRESQKRAKEFAAKQQNEMRQKKKPIKFPAMRGSEQLDEDVS